MHINSRHEPIDLILKISPCMKKILYYYNSHLCKMLSKKSNTNLLTFAYKSNITDNITVQCSLCAKRLHSQQPH